MTEDTKAILRSFINRVNTKVNPSTFIKHCQSNNLEIYSSLRVEDHSYDKATATLSGKFIPERTEYRNFPSEDSTVAFITHIRPFVQDNDPLSLRNLGRLKDVSPRFLKWLEGYRGLLNGWLDEKTGYEVRGMDCMTEIARVHTLSEKRLPAMDRRQVFEMFVYGDIAHTTKKHKEVLDTLGNELQYFRDVLHECLLRIFTTVSCTSEMCVAELNDEWDTFTARLAKEDREM